MISRLGDGLNRFARRAVPDPFVLAFALTGVVALGAAALMFSRGSGVSDVASGLGHGWLSDFSNPKLLAFALQMCLVLVTGHAIAMSAPVQRAIVVLSRIPRGPGSATALVALVACLAAIVHWGLGAIVGAFLAREIGRHAHERDLPIHYPLLGAGAYAGMAVWHGGLSGSAPTLVAKETSLSLADMLLSPLNIAVTGSLIIAIPTMFWLLTPKNRDELIGAPALPGSEPPAERDVASIAPRLLGIGGLAVVVALIAFGEAKLEINTINAIFLFSGIALVANLRRYVDLIGEGAKGAGAIIIQFPIYFGILGMMKASGMVVWLSEAMVSLGSKTLFPLMDFLSAGAVNLAVPSGGGQWVVQRDILFSAGEALGVDEITTIMAFSYGDAWTNMLQPFWALPLLAIMGLKAKDIIGYTAMVFLLMALIVPTWLLVLG